MAIIKPNVFGWAPGNLMAIDDHEGPGGNDGFLTPSEVRAHRQSLEARRDEYARTRSANSLLHYFTLQVEQVRRLEEQIMNAELWMEDVKIQYLPDELANLELPLRKRATDILRQDDDKFEGHIDQAMLQRAWDRYRRSGASTAVLAEIAAIASALGLKAPR